MTATEGGSPTVNEEGARALGSSYVVYERIGRGATGVVHRALDRRTGDPVAVKFLRSDFASDPNVVERFLRERAILTRLADPHTVGLRDLVVEGETVALVTDFVDGGDLRALLSREGPLPVDVAVDVAAQVLDGLASAHERGVVHCDLKPENVLVTRDGDHLVVRVTDFGIATLLRSSPSSTTPSSLVGSPDYMAPEVVEGRDLTPAADLYSAGILLYELLSGRTPFAGGPAVAVLRRHVEEPPLRLPDLPGAVWNQLVALLAKDPRRRPPSARVAASRLRASLDGGAHVEEIDSSDARAASAARADAYESPTYVPHTPPRGATAHRDGTDRERRVSTRRRRRGVVIGVVVVALVLAGVGIGVATEVSRRRASAASDHVRLTAPPMLQTSFGSQVVMARSWDLSGHDGSRVDVTLHVMNVGSSPVDTIDELPLEGGTTRRLTSYTVKLAPGQSTTISYHRTVTATGLDVRRIEQWEQSLDLYAAARLADAEARPAVLTLDRGQRAYLNVSGVTTAGDPARPQLLAGLSWSSSDGHVARVVSGTRADSRPIVQAGSPGAAVLTARLGTRELRVDVVVGSAHASAAAARLPCEPGIGVPADLVDVADGAAFTSDNHTVTVVAGGARVATGSIGDFAAGSPVPADADWLATLPVSPRDGTLLQDGPGGQLWLVVDGQRVAVGAGDAAALHFDPAHAVTVPKGTITVPVFGTARFPAGALVQPAGSGTTYVSDGHGWTTTSRACSASAVPTVPATTQLLPAS